MPAFGLLFSNFSLPFPLLEHKELLPPLQQNSKNPNPPSADPFSTPLLRPTSVPKYDSECENFKTKKGYSSLSEQPPVLAGDLLKDTFITRLDVLDAFPSIPHLLEFEEGVYQLFDSIANDEDFPIYVLQTYMLTDILLPNFARLEARKSAGWPFNCSKSDFAEGLELKKPFCDLKQPKVTTQVFQ